MNPESIMIYSAIFTFLMCCRIILPFLFHRKKPKEERWIVRWTCYSCGGRGDSRGDPEFDCWNCKGKGLISWPVCFGHTIYHEHRSRLHYIADLTERQRKRFIGFQPLTRLRAK